MDTEPKKYDFGTLTDEAGNNRLCLIYESRIYKGEERGFDFYSIVWEKKENGRWITHREITEKEFDSDPVYRKWISAIHSFNPESGEAVVQVGEGDAPRNSGQTIIYSWRKWNVLTNKQVKLLQVCKDPFEKFLGENS